MPLPMILPLWIECALRLLPYRCFVKPTNLYIQSSREFSTCSNCQAEVKAIPALRVHAHLFVDEGENVLSGIAQMHLVARLDLAQIHI